MTWNAQKQKWERDEMPLDATDPDSLVGRMLGVTVKLTSNSDQNRNSEIRPELLAEAEEFLDEYADDFTSLAASERAELPLWRVMELAHEQEAGSVIDHLGNTVLGEPDRFTRAAEIEAVRDHIFPENPEPSPVDPADGVPTAKWLRWHERQRLRALLTAQARIARGEA